MSFVRLLLFDSRMGFFASKFMSLLSSQPWQRMMPWRSMNVRRFDSVGLGSWWASYSCLTMMVSAHLSSSGRKMSFCVPGMPLPLAWSMNLLLLTYEIVKSSLDHFENCLISIIGSRSIPESVVDIDCSNNGRSGLANLTVFDGVWVSKVVFQVEFGVLSHGGPSNQSLLLFSPSAGNLWKRCLLDSQCRRYAWLSDLATFGVAVLWIS